MKDIKTEISLKDKQQLDMQKRHIPPDKLMSFGCNTCPWRFSEDKCPAQYFPEENFRLYPGEVCDNRLQWLLSYMPVYDKEPSHSQFLHDFGIGQNLLNMMEDREQIEIFTKKLEEHERFWQSEAGDDKYKKPNYYIPKTSIETTLRQLKKSYEFAMSQHLKYTDSQIGRDSTKKIDINVKNNISPSQYQRMLKGIKEAEVVDSEYDNIEELE